MLPVYVGSVKDSLCLSAVSLIAVDFEQSFLFLQLATRVSRASSDEAARLEKRGRQPEKKKESLSCFVPFLSRAFSHARVHSRAFCSTD